MFIPGPVDVAPEVLAAQAKPMMSHHSKDFEALFHRTEEKLQKLFFTECRIFQATASGSGMQEAAIRNLVQESVLSCLNGAYAERWYEVAVSNGKQADTLEVPWGQVIQPDALAEALKKKHYEAVTIVHNETSTGAENPVQQLAAVIHEISPETLVLVDAVSSLGGVKIEMDAWGIDYLLTSSQTCLALPPGLSLAGVSDRAMKKAETVTNRGWYFDLVRMDKHRIKDSTPITPVIPLIYALDVQTDRILAEGLDNRFARHAAMSGRVQTWAIEQSMNMMVPDPYRSKTVSVIQNSRGFEVAALNKFLSLRGMCIANGYSIWKEKTFRIATMGETQLSDVEDLLLAIEEFLKQTS